MDRTSAAYAVALLLGMALLMELAWRSLQRWLGRQRARRRQARASAGERDAERLLHALGYTICQRQATTIWEIVCDDAIHEVPLRADLIVERDGRRFVAEVKTGRAAPQLGTASTRRQLLEYRVAYDVDGVLLVDAEAGRVMDVDFPLPELAPARRTGYAASWRTVVCALLVGTAAGLAAGQWLDRLGP